MRKLLWHHKRSGKISRIDAFNLIYQATQSEVAFFVSCMADMKIFFTIAIKSRVFSCVTLYIKVSVCKWFKDLLHLRWWTKFTSSERSEDDYTWDTPQERGTSAVPAYPKTPPNQHLFPLANRVLKSCTSVYWWLSPKHVIKWFNAFWKLGNDYIDVAH